MAKEDRVILAVERSLLFPQGHFQGFRGAEEDYRTRILENYFWMRRGNYKDKHSAEGNPRFKHPIAYTLIINPQLKKAFAYQRATQDSRYHEKRLQGKWSLGVGGHIDIEDAVKNVEDPIYESLKRELGKEEVEFLGGELKEIRLLGYINDEEDSVGQVHFGMLYLATTDAPVVIPRDKEMEEGKLRTLAELEQILANPNFTVEGWSKIAFEQLKAILS